MADANTTYESVTDYNAKREQGINDLYDSQLASKKTSLENAYNQNLSNAQADKESMANSYIAQNNSLGAQYERNRRNANMQANANGLNTGAGSQMQLAQNSAYLADKTKLAQSEAEETAAADRNISNIKSTYQNDIIAAQSDNDAQRAAALLDEYSNAYNRIESTAKTLASYGDFSGYAALFGQETANNMKEMWIAQNPADAYNTGAIDANRYFAITGSWPAGYTQPVAETTESGGGGGDYYYGSPKDNTKMNDSESLYWANTYNQNTPATGGSKITQADYTANSSSVGSAAKAAMTDYNNRLAAHYGK